MKAVKRPEEVKYISKYAELGWTVFVDGIRVPLRWHKGELTLHVVKEAKVIEALDKDIEGQWALDENGEKIKDGNGNFIVDGKKQPVPIVKYDVYVESIQKSPIRIQLDPKDSESVVEVTPEEIQRLLKDKEKKGKTSE